MLQEVELRSTFGIMLQGNVACITWPWWLVVGKTPQAYITIKKRKHKNIGFKCVFHQCSFTITDVIFGCFKIYIWQNIEINNFTDI